MTNKRILTLITLLLFLFLLAGCEWPWTINKPPEITSTAITTATVGVTYTYNVIATDPNAGDVLTYSLTTEPEGMLINGTNGVITWEADDITAAGVGDYDVVVVVSDDDGLIDSQDFTITVSEFVKELVGIEVEPEEMTLCVSEEPLESNTGTLEVTANYNDDSTADVTSGCVYGIDNTTIATVDKDAGTVTALKVGTATISISYTEGGITKGTTLTIIVEGTITLRWLEAAMRYFPDGSVEDTWLNDPIPPKEWGPATLILTGGEYHFADVKDYYNIHAQSCVDLEGSVVISETGQLSGHTTYILNDLDTINDFMGQVEIIIYDEVSNIPYKHDGTMVGTYTQWKYVYGTEEEVHAEGKYPNAVLAPEQGPDWWFTGHTEYFAHGEDILTE